MLGWSADLADKLETSFVDVVGIEYSKPRVLGYDGASDIALEINLPINNTKNKKLYYTLILMSLHY